MPLRELAALVEQLGEAPYRAAQIFGWIHRRGAASFDEMSNVPKALREQLEARFSLAPLRVDARLSSELDRTRKLRFRCADGAAIEAVIIPKDEAKITLCVSSQAGCGLGCHFCATASRGLLRSLDSGEIVDQVYRARASLEEGERINNLVLMGMGEPLANLESVIAATEILCDEQGLDLSPRRITLSTAGVVPGIRRLGQRLPRVGLAVSLNATTDAERDRLMPVNRRWPLARLLEAVRSFPLPRRRRVTFEYVLIDGINDSEEDARRLPRLLAGIPAKINLLAFNSWPGAPTDLRRPPEERIDRFAELVRDADLTVTVRASRGGDIAAACGQLAAKST